MNNKKIKDFLNGKLKIETSRLIIRKFKETDINGWHNMMSNESVNNFLSGRIETYEESKDYVMNYIKKQEEGETSGFIIELKETNEAAGTINFNISKENETGNLGYIINFKHWGKGYATEVTKKMLEVGFEILKLNRIEADFVSSNIGSKKVLEKCGFKKEGSMRKAAYKSNENKFYDFDYYAILRNEYLKIKKN